MIGFGLSRPPFAGARGGASIPATLPRRKGNKVVAALGLGLVGLIILIIVIIAVLWFLFGRGRRV